ncbi:MAG: sigma-70 family RNA polymerase sigma factor [Prevotellaceae bacterium]|jgi:RNA polymerase sigma-70 factor (ECF subfamily)|nr:sigma-70 family RNA polymerase sigma factor [Prevotellaceae bacterium]
MESNIRELIAQCKKGQPKAQQQFYAQCYKLVYNTCLRLLNHTAEAEDAMQETFIKVFEKLDQQNTEESNFFAWLKRIAINTCLDKLRQKRMSLFPLDEKMAGLMSNPIVREEDLTLKVQQVKSAIMSLSDGYRVMLSLILLEGFDYEEVSEVLKITPSAARTQYSRGRQKLLAALSGKIINE